MLIASMVLQAQNEENKSYVGCNVEDIKKAMPDLKYFLLNQMNREEKTLLDIIAMASDYEAYFFKPIFGTLAIRVFLIQNGVCFAEGFLTSSNRLAMQYKMNFSKLCTTTYELNKNYNWSKMIGNAENLAFSQISIPKGWENMDVFLSFMENESRTQSLQQERTQKINNHLNSIILTLKEEDYKTYATFRDTLSQRVFSKIVSQDSSIPFIGKEENIDFQNKYLITCTPTGDNDIKLVSGSDSLFKNIPVEYKKLKPELVINGLNVKNTAEYKIETRIIRGVTKVKKTKNGTFFSIPNLFGSISLPPNPIRESVLKSSNNILTKNGNYTIGYSYISVYDVWDRIDTINVRIIK